MSEQLSQHVKKWNASKHGKWTLRSMYFKTPFEIITECLGEEFDYDLIQEIKGAGCEDEEDNDDIIREFIRRQFAIKIFSKPEMFSSLIGELEFVLELDTDELISEFFLVVSKHIASWPTGNVSIKEELTHLMKTIERLQVEEIKCSGQGEKSCEQRQNMMQNENNAYYLDHKKQYERWLRVSGPGAGTPLEYVRSDVLFERADVHYGRYEKGQWNLTPDDLHTIFEKRIYKKGHKTHDNIKWLSVLREEIEHLLNLGDPVLVEQGYFSLSSFGYWPDGVSVKEEFSLMAKKIREILYREKEDSRKGEG